MGQNLSYPQTVELSPNKKWLYLREVAAYVNISSVVYFQECYDDYMIFKIVDNSSNEGEPGVISKITTHSMSSAKRKEIIRALTE